MHMTWYQYELAQHAYLLQPCILQQTVPYTLLQGSACMAIHQYACNSTLHVTGTHCVCQEQQELGQSFGWSQASGLCPSLSVAAYPHLDASTLQCLVKLLSVEQGRACVLRAVQQQHRRHEVGVLGAVHNIGRRQRLQLSLALEAHDAVKEGVVQAPLVEVLPQVCAVIDTRHADQALDLGGCPLGGAAKDVLPAHGCLSLYNAALRLATP